MNWNHIHSDLRVWLIVALPVWLFLKLTSVGLDYTVSQLGIEYYANSSHFSSYFRGRSLIATGLLGFASSSLNLPLIRYSAAAKLILLFSALTLVVIFVPATILGSIGKYYPNPNLTDLAPQGRVQFVQGLEIGSQILFCGVVPLFMFILFRQRTLLARQLPESNNGTVKSKAS